MPAEYLACVAGLVKEGKAHKDAQKICAIAYYKKHGKTVQEAHEKGEPMGDIGKNDVNVFAPIEKIDSEQRMVYGYASTPSLDSQGEIVELEATFEAAEEWKKWRNIREMHQASAVGIAPIVEKHVGKGLYIGAKIVDDSAWKKCVEGVYKGFSIGGKCLARTDNRITKYRLNEISLVDRFANPDSMFMVMKRDDSALDTKEVDTLEKVEQPAVAPPAEVAKTEKPPETQTPAVMAKPAPETVAKSEYDALLKQVDELKKAEEVRKKEDDLKTLLVKVAKELQPEVKKIQSEAPKPEEQVMREALEKMDIGQLTALMLKMGKGKEER